VVFLCVGRIGVRPPGWLIDTIVREGIIASSLSCLRDLLRIFSSSRSVILAVSPFSALCVGVLRRVRSVGALR
jgi:hypothetical protein